jgi:outer membrane usher protein
MASRSNKQFRSAICLASALLLRGLAVAAPEPDPAPDPVAMTVIADSAEPRAGTAEDLYLEVVLNGNPTRRIAHFTRDAAHFRAAASTLRELGFRLPAGEGGASVDVGNLVGVTLNYDAARQRIEITAPPALLDQKAQVLNAREVNIPHPQASPGVLLNYDLYATRDDRDELGLSAYSELRAFNAWGVLSSTAITRVSDSPGSDWTDDTARLDTTFTRSFVDDTTTLRIGDAISGSLTWTRATRFGGVQLERNFSLQPDLVTFPVPAFYGQAALPSTVDLYIDGLKQYSGQVPAGPFQLNTVPVVNGNGEAQVVVTDALGRQSTLAFPFYTSGQLLRQGLSDYSLEAGFVRENYGVASFSYNHDPAASGSYRYGVTDWMTVESHAEASAGLSDGGAGTVIGLGSAGVVNAAAAASSYHGASGSLAELGYNWRNERFNFSLDSTRSFGSYRDVASLDGLPPARRSDRALAGVTAGPLGSVGVSYVQLRYPGQDGSRYASAFYFRSLGSHASFNLSFNQDLDNHSDRSVFLGVSLSFDNGTSVSLSAQHDQQGNLTTLDASQPINPDGGFGWRARAQDGDNQSGGLAEVGYRGEHGQVLAGAQSLAGATQGYADLSGALVFMDGQMFASRQIQDAFAVVSTDGVANVPVMLENRPIGTTNAAGDLLVTPLNAYQRNKLAIDPMQLPADVHIDRVDAEVVPSDRAGALVRFGIQPVAAASIVLHSADGKPLQVGSTAQLIGKPTSTGVVGYDGIVYLEGLGAHNTVVVQTPAGGCQVQFDYHAEKQNVPVIGPLVCRGEKP